MRSPRDCWSVWRRRRRWSAGIDEYALIDIDDTIDQRGHVVLGRVPFDRRRLVERYVRGAVGRWGVVGGNTWVELWCASTYALTTTKANVVQANHRRPSVKHPRRLQPQSRHAPAPYTRQWGQAIWASGVGERVTGLVISARTASVSLRAAREQR